MSDTDKTSESVPCVTQQSANKLKFTISLSGSKGCSSESRTIKESDVLVEVTSRNLYLVLSHIHAQLVRRDPKGIFAHPVTDDIAIGYSETISHPMDLGTIYDRLCSRAFYRSASEYLADVMLMCDNAMVYNQPDTIYYQRARKLLAYCRKQMTPSTLRKLCDQLELTGGLKDSELGDVQSPRTEPSRHHKLGRSHHRLLGGNESSARSSSRISPGSESRLDQSCHGVQRCATSIGSSRVSASRVPNKHERPNSQKRVRSRHLEQPSDAASPESSSSFYGKRHRRSSHDSGGSLKSENSNRSPISEGVPLPSKSVSTPGMSPSQAGLQETARLRGRPRKTPLPADQSPPIQLGIAESDNSLPNSPPHLSTISSSSPSSTSMTRRNASFCPSPVSSSVRADSPAARSMSAGSDVLSTNASIGTAPLDAPVCAGPTTPTTSVKSPQPMTQTVNLEPGDVTSDSSCPVLQPTTFSTPASVRDTSTPTPATKRGRGRPPKWSHQMFSGTNIGTTGLLSSPRRASKRPLGVARSSGSVKRRAVTQSPTSLTTDEDEPEQDAECLTKSPVPKSDATTQVEDEVLDQARAAAERAAANLRMKYAGQSRSVHGMPDRIGPRTVYLNCDAPGQVTAISCPWAESSNQPMRMDLGGDPPDRLRSESRSLGPVHFPEVLNQVLTGYRSRAAFAPEVDLDSDAAMNREANSRQKPYVPLVDPFNADQLEDLRQLSKLKYNVDEPISVAVHGPLAVFTPEELGQMAEIYGGDLSVMEYAFSLLSFVEPMGRWARRWATKQLDLATDGLHSQFAQSAKLSWSESENGTAQFPMWMRTAGLTIDSPSPPCSPKLEPQMEFDDGSFISFLHSLGEADPPVLLSTESALPITTENQTVFTGTTEVNALPIAICSVYSAPVSTNVEACMKTVPSISTTGSTLIHMAPVSSSCVVEPSQLDSCTTAVLPPVVGTNGPLLASTVELRDTVNGSNNAELSSQSEPVKSQAMIVSNDELSNSSAPTSSCNSLLKSVLHGVDTGTPIVERSANLLVSIPTSPGEGTVLKLTARSDSLVQHSPQVTVPMELLVTSVLPGERTVESHSLLPKYARTSEPDQKTPTLSVSTTVETTSEPLNSIVRTQFVNNYKQASEEKTPSITLEGQVLDTTRSTSGQEMIKADVPNDNREETPDIVPSVSTTEETCCSAGLFPLKLDDEVKHKLASDSASVDPKPESPASCLTADIEPVTPELMKVKPEGDEPNESNALDESLQVKQSAGEPENTCDAEVSLSEEQGQPPLDARLNQTAIESTTIPFNVVEQSNPTNFVADSTDTPVLEKREAEDSVTQPKSPESSVLPDPNSKNLDTSSEHQSVLSHDWAQSSATSGSQNCSSCVIEAHVELLSTKRIEFPFTDRMPEISATAAEEEPLLCHASEHLEDLSADVFSPLAPLEVLSLEPVPISPTHPLCMAQFAPAVLFSLHISCTEDIEQTIPTEFCFIEPTVTGPLVSPYPVQFESLEVLSPINPVRCPILMESPTSYFVEQPPTSTLSSNSPICALTQDKVSVLSPTQHSPSTSPIEFDSMNSSSYPMEGCAVDSNIDQHSDQHSHGSVDSSLKAECASKSTEEESKPQSSLGAVKTLEVSSLCDEGPNNPSLPESKHPTDEAVSSPTPFDFFSLGISKADLTRLDTRDQDETHLPHNPDQSGLTDDIADHTTD